MGDEIDYLLAPESFESFLRSLDFSPLVEKYGVKEASIRLAKAFTEKIINELEEKGRAPQAEAIRNTKKSFVTIIARRYLRLLEANNARG